MPIIIIFKLENANLFKLFKEFCFCINYNNYKYIVAAAAAVTCLIGLTSSPDGTCLMAMATKAIWQNARSGCGELGRLPPGGWAGRLYENRGKSTIEILNNLYGGFSYCILFL